MKMIILSSNGVNGKPHRIGLLPTGNLIVEEKDPNVTIVRTATYSIDVLSNFDQLIENLNADLESWKG